MIEPDQLPRAAETDDSDWHNHQGEVPDHGSTSALQLAYRALHKFPDIAKRHRYQKFIGTAAVVSSVLVGLATIAIDKRLHRGESPQKILDEITADEIVSAAKDGKKRKGPSKKNNGNGRFLH